MAQMNYIADTNDQYTGYDCLPAGEYKVQIVDSDIAPSKSGDAEMLKLTYEVIADPQYDGRKIFDNLIMDHRTSTDAVRIGKQKLNTICALTGVKSLKDSAQLHTKTLTLLVGIREYNGEKQNTIKKYLPFSGNNAVVQDEDYKGLYKDDTPVTSKPKFVK